VTTIEHANITVPNIDAALEFINIVAPDFTIRRDEISELGYRWVHIGDAQSYFALQEPHPGFDPQSPHEAYRNLGVNHLCLTVNDAAAIEKLLLEKDYKPNGPMINDTYRKRIYFYDRTGIEWEMIEYLSDDPDKKNLYE